MKVDPYLTLWAMLGIGGHFHELRNLEQETVCWMPCDRSITGAARRMRLYHQISPAPRSGEGSSLSPHSHALWAKTYSKRSSELLRRFRPFPTVVLRDGETCRYTAVWALSERIPYNEAYEMNKRLAHRLASPKKEGDPEAAWIPLPRDRISVAYINPEASYELGEFHLPALPQPFRGAYMCNEHREESVA